MSGAFFYLSVCSFRNGIRLRLRRFREPRYAIGLVLGLGYLAMIFRRSFMRHGTLPASNPVAAFLAANHGGLEVVGAVAFLLLGTLAWVFVGSTRPALAFTAAEVQWLFPAPVTRRELIHYKILRSQMGSAVGSLIVTVLLHVGDLASAWRFFLGMWLVMVSINLHLTGVSLRRQSLVEHRGDGARYQWVPLIVIVAMIATLVAAVVSDWSVLAAATNATQLLGAIDRIGQTPAVRIVLFPLVALIRLPLADTNAAFPRALPMAAAVLMANYLWVVRSDASFQESSAAFAERQAELQASAGQSRSRAVARRRREPFALRPMGRPEVAFLWKNLMLIGRYANIRLFLRIAIGFVVWGVLLSQRAKGPADALATFCVVGAGVTVLFGAQWVRSDLRQDLAHLTVLRTWPLSGAAIVRGEVLAPTVLLTAIVWLFVIAATSLVAGHPFGRTIAPLTRVSYGIAALLITPGLVLMQVVVNNAIAALFPAWVPTMTNRSRGVDVMGQRMLMSGGLLLTLVLGLLPAAAVAALVGFGIHALTGVIPVVVPAATATIVLAIECALVIEAIGAALDRADVATLPPPQ